MRVVLFLLLLLFSSSQVDAKLKELIYPQAVDSVRILMISPLGNACFGGLAFDRGRFDIVYHYYHNNLQTSTDTYEVLLKGWNEVSLFIAILNNLEGLPIDEIKVSPDEVKTNPNANWLKGLCINGCDTNDPIESRVKLTLYMTDGGTMTAFMSSKFIDIQNYRYHCGILADWIEYIARKGYPTFGEPIIYRKELCSNSSTTPNASQPSRPPSAAWHSPTPPHASLPSSATSCSKKCKCFKNREFYFE